MSVSPPLPPCDYCGKYVGEYVVVLKPLSNGEQAEVLACDNCVTRYETVQFFRIRLDKIPYILGAWPPFQSKSNGSSLFGLFDGKQATLAGKLSLETFPLMEDFEVILEWFVKKHLLEEKAFQYEVNFFSLSHGYLAHFWTNNTVQDLCREDFIIPCGTFDAPFIDFAYRWGESILIAEDEQFVYVLTHNEKESAYHFPALTDYEHSIWFKIEKRRYYSQWEQAIQLCRTWGRKFL